MTTQPKREQWEALIVEPSVWRRTRQVTEAGRGIVFDAEDQENLEMDLQNEFRRVSRNVDPQRLYSVDHPLARFYRLMYTDEFEDFRRNVLRENVIGKGVVEMSQGVREMVMDQIFRYFVFVEENPVSAVRFGQLIVAVAVFRNTYDDDSRKFIEGGIMKSRRRLYKTLTSTVSSRSVNAQMDGLDYVDLTDLGIPAKYESSIASVVVKSVKEGSGIVDVLPLGYYGNFPTDDLTFTSPLNVHTSVFSPLRKFALHVMHLLSKLVTERSMENGVKLVYVGSATPEMLLVVRDILPPSIKLVQGVDKITADSYTVVVLDEENHLEASVAVGDDSRLMKQIATTLAVKNNFRQHPERLLGVSLFIRPPSVLSGNGTFDFLPGDIYLTSWKNPQDERLRLVWTPDRFSSELVEYGLRKFTSARKFQDYVVRPLYRFLETALPETLTPLGLVVGEFDSELERLVIGMYYNKFASGKRTWAEIVDVETDILVAPRFIKGDSYVWNKTFLRRYHESVVQLHLDTVNNPLLSHVARVMRGGLFPTVNLGKTPLVESVEAVFGTGSVESSTRALESYVKVQEDQRNVIMTLKEKNIFPRETDKTLMVALIKSLTRNFREIALFEPAIGSHRQIDYMYGLDTGLGRGEAVNIVHLGDSFGNLLYDVYMELDRLRVKTENVYTEGTFPLSQVWKYITRDEPPTFVQIKNVYELKVPLESSGIPFFLLRGYGFPKDIFNAFAKAWGGSRLFRGVVEVGPDGKIFSTPGTANTRPKDLFDTAVARKVQNAARGSGKTCLFIGSEHESSLTFLSKNVFSRVFHIVESGAGARRVMDMMTGAPKKTLNKVFVRENMSRNFVLPVEGDRYDYIFCNPVVFTRLTRDPRSAAGFFSELEKAMRPDSTFQTVSLDRLVRYAYEMGTAVEGYGRVLSNRFVDLEVLDDTFRLHNIQGFRTRLDELHPIYTSYGLRSRTLDKDQYGGYDTDPEDPEEEDTPDSPRRFDAGERQFGGEFTLSRLDDLLTVIEFVKERITRPLTEAYEAYEGQAVDVGARVRQYNNLIKRTLIGQVRKRQRVLDLACGHGQDINKWFNDESVETYVGMDASEAAIEEAGRRLKSRRGFKPKNVKFMSRDLFGTQEWFFDAQTSVRRGVYDVVSCQLAIHYAFSEESVIRRFLYNVSSLMEMGGEFIVSTIDDQVIRSMVLSQTGKRPSSATLRGEHYILELESDTVGKIQDSGRLPPGVSYRFTQFPSDPMSRTTTEYVVDHEYFRGLAREMGLELLASTNFLEGAGEETEEEKNNLLTEDKEIVAFYKTYRFRKVEEPREVQAVMDTDFKYTESKQQFGATVKSLDSIVASKIVPFKRGLFVSPEYGFPGPYVSEGYDLMHVLTEDVNSVRFIAGQLQRRGRLTDKETIAISRLPGTETYDMIFLSYAVSSNPELHLNKLAEGGSIYGVFVTMERVDELIETGDSTFANYIFDLSVSRRMGVFSINEPLDLVRHGITYLESLRETAARLDLKLDITPSLPDNDPVPNVSGKQYTGLFGVYRLTKESTPLPLMGEQLPASKKPSPKGKKRMVAAQTIEQPPPQEEQAPIDVPVETGGEEDVDRFVLLPGLVQKKAPGKGKDETLRVAGGQGTFKDLARDLRWRFKLSDDWESEEFMIRTGSGETFTSVKNAMIYFKCVYIGEENEDYRGLNRSTGLPQPEDMRPFTKAVRGKRGALWKEEEARILRSVYEAKYTNTPNVTNDDPENLSPLRALLLTKNAQLYSSSKTRNELLEMIRNVLQRIVVA